MNFLNHLLKNTRFTGRSQIFFVILFFFVMGNLFFGSTLPGNNPGTTITWLLWWPLIPLTFVLAGRFWCAVCPFGAVSDWTRRAVGLNLPVPPLIKKSGLWIINGLFIFITWYDLTFGLTTSVQATVMFFLFVLISALLFSFLFEKRAWCRYACPVGGVFGNYAQTSFIEMQNNEDVCAQCRDLHCFHGRGDIPECGLALSPKTLSSNRMCNFCGDCLQSCEKGSAKLGLRPKLGTELWVKAKPRFDEAFLAVALVALISISTLGMLEIWPVITGATGESDRGGVLINSFYMLLIFIGILGIYTVGASISAKIADEETRDNFTRFGYALIPMSLATHVAHNMNHFLGEGKLIIPAIIPLFTFAPSGTSGPAEHGTAALVSAPFIQGFQFMLVGLGILLSLYVVNRISNKDGKHEISGTLAGSIAWPHFFVIAVYGFLSFWLFSLPMMMRH